VRGGYLIGASDLAPERAISVRAGSKDRTYTKAGQSCVTHVTGGPCRAAQTWTPGRHIFDQRCRTGAALGEGEAMAGTSHTRKRWGTIAVLALMVTVLLAAAGGRSAAGSSGSSDARTNASEPPFAVGYETVSLVDSTRGTPAWSGVPASSTRTIDTLVMYPARGEPDGASVSGARPVRRGRFPVVVFLHGSATTAEDYRQAIEPWARGGYVVVAPTAPLGGLGLEQSSAARSLDVSNHPDDVRFVLRELPGALRRAIRTRADFDRVAVTGKSFGAGTALAVTFDPCCRSDAIRAVVAMAGAQSSLVASGADVATLIVHGDADEVYPYAAGRANFDAAPTPKFLLTLIGISHNPTLAAEPAGPPDDALVTTTSDFFDRYLKAKKGALERMRRHGNISGVAQLESASNTRS
jgi:dienelactone hydrolase